MKVLRDILNDFDLSESVGSLELLIQKVEFDSRCITSGDLFVAVRGVHADGHRFIKQAIDKGAVAIVAEQMPEEKSEGISYLIVPNSQEALGSIAANYYQHPSQELKLVGVTGTNGKTTTVTLLHDLLTEMGYKAGLLSTVENRIGRTVVPATHTTPDAISLNRLLLEMVDAGCDYAFMEVSSHAVHQRRIAGVHFAGAVFSNITHDHLDYHKTFKAYIEAKKAFFDGLSPNAFALSNVDDKRGGVMLQNTSAQKNTYSIRKLADFKAKIIENELTGLLLQMDGVEMHSSLIGEFNAYNLLAVYATGILLGHDRMEVLTALSRLKAAEGRFDTFQSDKYGVLAIVDYSHTPDSLEKALSTIQKIRKGAERIITVVGAGGDRDKTKRPKMAKVACDYSDQVILTSDNPRSEVPETIIKDMEAGVPANAQRKTLSITNRKEAIKTACRIAQKGDIILVAGKGHEKYQEINGVKHPFDDKAILMEALK
ncbi:MAG: UDP-N-acetylmuramoyl-L-alanyl-D-glutamate--2,6-diaminopimelate ligase [Bacteroidota bacterium]